MTRDDFEKNHGYLCPNCRSENIISYGDSEHNVRCKDYKSTWYELVNVVDYFNLIIPDGNEVKDESNE